MLNLEARVLKLEKQISTLIRNMSNGKKYMENDIEAGRENTAKAQRSADKNAEKIEDLYKENGSLRSSQIETEQTITDVDLQMIENEQMITDMDLRLMTLEV